MILQDGDYILDTGIEGTPAMRLHITWHDDAAGSTAVLVFDTGISMAIRAGGGSREDVVMWLEERKEREGVKIEIGMTA